jgi:hypothetical protein
MNIEFELLRAKLRRAKYESRWTGHPQQLTRWVHTQQVIASLQTYRAVNKAIKDAEHARASALFEALDKQGYHYGEA